MKKTFISIASVFIIVGVIGVAFNMIFGLNASSYLVQRNINGIYLYEIDIWSYINNIRSSIQNTAELTLVLPTNTWDSRTPTMENFGTILANNLTYLFNYFLVGLNVLLYPIRVGGYLGRNVWTIMGLNATNPPESISWLIDTINTLIGLQIPYV